MNSSRQQPGHTECRWFSRWFTRPHTCVLLQKLCRLLEVVLPYIKDAKTLAACARTSRNYQALTYTSIKQNLPALLLENARKAPIALQQTAKWLCRRAGPEVINNSMAIEAILQLIATQKHDDALSLTDSLLVAGYWGQAVATRSHRDM